MFVSFFQAQHPQPSVYMRCQLQNLILCKFDYLAPPQATIDAQHDLLDEVIRLVHPVSEFIGLDLNSELSEPGIAAVIQSFVKLVSEVGLHTYHRVILTL